MNVHAAAWQAEALWLSVEPRLPGLTIEILPEVDSSNSELMRRARAGQVYPTVLVAEHQTAGRGRQGRRWQGQPGDSLMYSLGLLLQPKEWSGLSLVVGLSIAQSLRTCTQGGAQPAPLGIKWPNDLWLRDGRKLGGTLIETANVAHRHDAPVLGKGSEAPRFVIIGTGMNVRPPQVQAGLLTTPPACLQELDSQWTAPRALHQILPQLVQDLRLFAEEGFAPFQSRFAQHDVLYGQPVHVSDGSAGEAAGVDADGTLLLRTPQGLQRVLSGDVSVRPQHMALPPAPL